MNKTIKCILFDLDGTLIDSGPDLIDSLNFVLKKQKLETIRNDVIGSLVGGGAEAMIKRAYRFLGKKIPNDNLDLLINDFLKFYSKNYDNKSCLYPDVKNTIKDLKSSYKIALCTNKKQILAEKILRSYQIEQNFDFVLGSNSNLKLKPNTEMLDYSLKKLNIAPHNSIMIGDSINDILPAKILGMHSIFVTYGYGSYDQNNKPDYIVQNFNEITNILNN